VRNQYYIASLAKYRYRIQKSHGFTLIEIAFTLIIIGFIFDQLLTPFGAQLQQQKRQVTDSTIINALDAIVGYAIANRRLPCPAGDDTSGHQREQCLSPLNVGFVPATTLGVGGEIDSKGRLLDAWGRPLIYAVSDSDHLTQGIQGMPDFLTVGEMSNVGLSYLESDIIVCREVTNSNCARKHIRANQIPVLILSLGANDQRVGQELHNQTSTSLFVTREFSEVSGHEFDDIVHWLSESLLFHALVKAEAL